MNMISQTNLNNPGTVNMAQEIESLLPMLRKLADLQPESQVYKFLTQNVESELKAIVQKGGGYTEAGHLIQSHQHLMTLIASTLGEMLANLEHLQQARIRREKYSSHWWEQTVQLLHQAFEEDPKAAFQQWIMIYAQALVDWELETCRNLASTPFSYPTNQLPYILLIRHGDISLQKKDYPPTLKMLDYLVGYLSKGTTEEQCLLGALLSIFMGRINLFQMHKLELARQAFDRAAALIPYDGRPLAALGYVSLKLGEEELAEANRLFSRAIEMSPDQPEGYVGKAIIAERRELWSEADYWYEIAVKESLDERDVLQFLSKMLAPGSGRMYLHIARQLLADNNFDPALEAIERSLELGMDDGSNYSSRNAIALKAAILLAKSGSKPSAEETKIIADLYFDAGQLYTWNNEFQTAVDLLKKGHELDGQNALMLFFLADDLRALSYKSTPPYYSSADLVRESLAAWDAGIKVSKAIHSDTAWIYVSRSDIAALLALLPEEDENQHHWQAILYNEKAIILNEDPGWWSALSNSYEQVALYANMLHASFKAVQGGLIDSFTLEARTQALIATGQFKSARKTLNKLLKLVEPENIWKYQSLQAQLNFYLGNFNDALEDLKSSIEMGDPLAFYHRAMVYRALGKYREAIEDARWIWEKREDPDYEKAYSFLAWASYLVGMFEETKRQVEPLLVSARVEDQFDGQLLLGLSCLALGDFKLADEYLSQVLEECINPRLLIHELIEELEQLQLRASREKWPRMSSISAHLSQSNSILKLAKLKQRKMKTFKAEPIKELESVLQNPVTGQVGSWSWLAAQAGLGRLQLEGEHLEAAMQAYQTLSLYPQQVPEANTGLNKVRKKMKH